MSEIKRESIEFLSDRIRLRGELFVPGSASGAAARPAVLLSHGWGMTADGNLVDFAVAFAQAGFIAMTIDFRNLGRSDGTVRQDINPFDQVDDIRNAITFLSEHPEVDSDRIGIWGSSFSGGHAIVVSAIDRRVKCVVSQVPTIHGPRAARLKMSDAEIAREQKRFADDRRNVLEGAAPALIKTVSADPDQAVLYPGLDSYEYMSGDDARSSNWRNETTLRSLDRARAYIPAAYMPEIAPTPLLMVIATDDAVCHTQLQLEAFEAASGPKKLHVIRGGHYTPYVDAFKEASVVARAWFIDNL